MRASESSPRSALSPTSLKLFFVFSIFYPCRCCREIINHVQELASHVDVLVCDEGHRLKNSLGNKTIGALASIDTAKRIILTGESDFNLISTFQ